MKYIHDGTNYVIWYANSGISHTDMAYYAVMTPLHAGFITFGQPGEDGLKPEHVVFGKSNSLNLESSDFELGELFFVGIRNDDFLNNVVSNSKDVLNQLNVVTIEQGYFKVSLEGLCGTCPAWYPGHRDDSVNADHVLAR